MFRYIGSKASTANNILDIVDSMADVVTVADAYGGLGTIGSVLKSSGYKVSSCDVLLFPHTFQVARIECDQQPKFEHLLNRLGFKSIDQLGMLLSTTKDENSWFVREYCINRNFFSVNNGELIAGAWKLIREWKDLDLISIQEQSFIMASFLNSVDLVANTAGTYYAHLKVLYRKALKPYQFNWIPITQGSQPCEALHGDALESLNGRSFDLLYLDPPYNKRNYAAYYHLPETLAHLKEAPVSIDRKSGVPINSHPGTAQVRNGTELSYIQSIIESVNWKNLIIHYCDFAYIPLPKIRNMLNDYGDFKEHEINALGYSTSKTTRKTLHNVFVVNRK